MNLSIPKNQLIQPFHVAGMLWGDLSKLDAIHWQCGEGTESARHKWFRYDHEFHRTPPRLNKRFRRGLFVDLENRYFQMERLAYLKMLNFFMAGAGQVVVMVSTEMINHEDISKLVIEAGFKDVKKIQDGCILTYKY